MKRPPSRARARCSHERPQGFTLLEVLVAIAIMAMALGMLYQAAGNDVRTMARIQKIQRASMLGESLLAWRDAVPSSGWNADGTDAGFSWSVRSAPYATAVNAPTTPPLHEIHLTVSWLEDGRLEQIGWTTLRPQLKPIPGSAR